MAVAFVSLLVIIKLKFLLCHLPDDLPSDAVIIGAYTVSFIFCMSSVFVFLFVPSNTLAINVTLFELDLEISNFGSFSLILNASFFDNVDGPYVIFDALTVTVFFKLFIIFLLLKSTATILTVLSCKFIVGVSNSAVFAVLSALRSPYLFETHVSLIL